MKSEILRKLKGGLIVSCQAFEGEPLYMRGVMARMAIAARQAGAVGIRANGVQDIKEIRNAVDLPIIGLIKRSYSDSDVYITPTLREIEKLVEVGADIIATDATDRLRPNGQTREIFFTLIRSTFPDQLFMADCATVEDGLFAEEYSFDIIGTTMCGYTDETKEVELPNYKMINALVKQCKIPVFAEGGIWTPEALAQVYKNGAYSAVVGSAITRPHEIAKRFVDAIK